MAVPPDVHDRAPDPCGIRCRVLPGPQRWKIGVEERLGIVSHQDGSAREPVFHDRAPVCSGQHRHEPIERSRWVMAVLGVARDRLVGTRWAAVPVPARWYRTTWWLDSAGEQATGASSSATDAVWTKITVTIGLRGEGESSL